MTVLTKSQLTRSATIRDRLPHPVIDTDVHTIEFLPTFLEYLDRVGGAAVVDRFVTQTPGRSWVRWHSMTWEERRASRAMCAPWWGLPTDALTVATVSLPKLLHERLQEAGTDFAVVYPNISTLTPSIENEEVRRAACRAANIYNADIYREYADRLSPVAAIPMHTPEEAIEELEYAVNVLGLKAIQIAGNVRRPIPAVVEKYPEMAKEGYWIDTFGLDSEHDYDPFWAKCVELKVVPTTHTIGMGWTTRRSISNYQYNHIGHFASAAEALCKSLFFGGVTYRFPTLKFAFLECGVSWGAALYADLVWHWERRHLAALEKYNPANLDRELLLDLYNRYGGKEIEGKRHELRERLNPFGVFDVIHPGGDFQPVEDFGACHIEKAEDVRERFIPNFYFGCEADDSSMAWAFNTQVNPFGAKLNAFLASDFGHWDVPDITAVLSDVYELFEKGILTEEDFRNFVFTNPAKLYAETNPDFFKGTAVEKAVNELLIRAK